MEINKINPITNGCRHQYNIKKNLLSKSNNLLKLLQQGISKKSGRSSITGRITVRHKGGGCKQKIRRINWENKESYSIIISMFYDPIRNSFINLNYNFLRNFFYLSLATMNLLPGSLIICSKINVALKLGTRLPLFNVPVGSLIHSLSTNHLNKVLYIRSAGTLGILIQKNKKIATIRLPSRIILEVSVLSYVTLGIVSNNKNNLIVLGKAGRSRLMNKRPKVRGVAMNPVDHPHGGRTNGGRPSVTPWGKLTKGKPTVKKK